MFRHHLGVPPRSDNIQFIGEIPLLKDLFDKFVKNTSTSPDYKVFVLRAIEIVYCILPEYRILKVSTQTTSYTYDVRYAYVSSLGGYFSKNFHGQEMPPAAFYTVDPDGTIVVDLNYLNNIVEFVVNGPESSVVLTNIFNKFLKNPRAEGPGGLGNEDFIKVATSLFQNSTDRAFLYFNIFFLNLGFFRITCLESFLDFSSITFVNSPVFCIMPPDTGMSLAKRLFEDVSTIFKNIKIGNIDSYEKLQALYALYFSEIPVAKFAPLIADTLTKLKVSDSVLQELLASKVLSEIVEKAPDINAEEILKRALCIAYLCDQKYLRNRKLLNRKVAEGTTLDRYFLSLPIDLQGVLSSKGKMLDIFSDLQQNTITALEGKAWLGGLKPVSARRNVNIEGKVQENEVACSLESLLKQGPTFVNNQFTVPKGSYTVLSLLSFVFKQFPLNPSYPSVRVLFFTNSKTKKFLTDISDTTLDLYVLLVFYTVQCFVQKNCMSVTSIKELPEQVLSSKSSNVTVETKTRDTLKLALGMSLGLTIFTSTVLAFKIYQHLKEKRDSK